MILNNLEENEAFYAKDCDGALAAFNKNDEINTKGLTRSFERRKLLFQKTFHILK